MDFFSLAMPVYAADKSLLLPAGTVLTPKIMADLAYRGQTARSPVMPAFEYASVRKDFREFISRPPYQTIFARRHLTEETFEAMGAVNLPVPILLFLDQFKRHDSYTYRHMLLVFGLAMLLVGELGPVIPEIKEVLVTPTHDIGKIAVPPEILSKSEPLTRDERLILSQHVLTGFVLLTYYQENALVARDHHERRNGTGYLQGLKQNDLVVEIIAACDVYDSLISPRPFRPKPYKNRAALEEITAMADRKEISWDVVRALISVNRKDKLHYTRSEISRERRCPSSGDGYST